MLRSEPGVEDDYGNVVGADEAVVQTFRALFAPANSEEQTEPGRNATIRGGVVYKRGGPAPDVRPSDHVTVDGRRYAVQGEVGEWRKPNGLTVGWQFGVQAVDG